MTGSHALTKQHGLRGRQREICGADVAISVPGFQRKLLVSGVTIRPLETRRRLRSLCLAWRRDRGDVDVDLRFPAGSR